MARSDTVLPAPITQSLDVLEQLTSGAAAALVFRRGTMVRSGSQPLLSTSSGSVLTLRFSGFHWWQCTSAAATVNGRSFSDLQFPVGQDYSAMPAGGQLPTLWTLEAVLTRGAALVANAPLFFGITQTVGQLSDHTNPGFGLSSTSTENGGNWTVHRRARAAGALVPVDTGIASTTPVYARLRYLNTSAPAAWVEINGVEVGRVDGIANVPQIANAAGNAWAHGFWQGLGVGGGVGQVDRVRQVRVVVDEQPGYE